MTIRLKFFGNTKRPPKPAIGYLGKFLVCLIGTSAVCLAGYTAVVDKLVQSSNLPATYKWFLLKNVPGPRIIFESGSNSQHAIDTDMLGQALGMTAINIGDNGGYAIEDKITRLETFTHPGDVVILPLDWDFYHREKLTDNYIETLFNSNRDYYRSMPFIKRMKRALSLPPGKVITEISRSQSQPAQDVETPDLDSPAKELFFSALRQPTGAFSRSVSVGPNVGIGEQSCDNYVLGAELERQNLTLSTTIKPALKRLQKLQSRGVDIHFAWPALAGAGCLTDPAYFTGFRDEIELAVNKAGFQFIGTPSQSLYGQAYQDDTPYHIITAATEIHTKKMISFLRAKGYGTTGESLDIKSFARHRLLELELAQLVAVKRPALSVDQTLSMGDPDIRNQIEFSAGWWDSEPVGRWMRDNRAMFRITLPEALPENSVLKIQGNTKSNSPETVAVSYNGRPIASGSFGTTTPLLIPVGGLPREETLSIFIDLPEAGIPRSPSDLGENEDIRSMTLQFQSMQLTTSAPLPFEYIEGWWTQEPTGRWMKGQQADFVFKLPERDKSAQPVRYTFKLKGDFFLGKPRPVELLVDGELVETVQTTRDGTLTTSFIKTTSETDVKVTIKFTGPDNQSPKELGLSQDDRTMTYFLKSIELFPT